MIPSLTARSYTFDMHQVTEGDLILWNDQWSRVQTIHRDPNAPAFRQVVIHAYGIRPGVGHVTVGQECQTITVVPRPFARPELLSV